MDLGHGWRRLKRLKKFNQHDKMTWHTTQELDSTHFICSVGQEAAFSLTSYLDTIRLERARLKNTQEMSSSPDNETESCQTSQSSETYENSTEHPGEEQLMFFAEDSHVRTSVRRVKEQELPGHARDFGRNMRDSLEKCGLDLSLQKTHLCFALGDLELSSKTWPRWGIMLDGECSELGMSVRHINETECGSWPTPKAHEPGMTAKTTGRGVEKSTHLTTQVALAEGMIDRKTGRLWPTPTTMDKLPPKSAEALHREAIGGESIRQTYPTPRCFMHKDALTDRGKSNLGEVINEKEKMTKTGQLNPDWVEILMGWPRNWTDMSHLNLHDFKKWLVSWNGEEKHTNKTVPNMRKLDGSKEIREEAGGFQCISTEEILLAFVCEYEAGFNQVGMALQGKEISEEGMRVLWDWGKASSSPYRRELQARCGGELSDFVHLVSQVYPSYGQKAWEDGTWEFATPRVAHGINNRVNRLKAIGNGQVSLCAAVAFSILSEGLI
jgi:hypothetical protein